MRREFHSAEQAWNQFLSTGEISDYLWYKQLQQLSEVKSGRAGQDQWNHSSGSYDGRGRSSSYHID